MFGIEYLFIFQLLLAYCVRHAISIYLFSLILTVIVCFFFLFVDYVISLLNIIY